MRAHESLRSNMVSLTLKGSGVFPKAGVPCWGSHNKDHSILGSLLGYPYVGKLASLCWEDLSAPYLWNLLRMQLQYPSKPLGPFYVLASFVVPKYVLHRCMNNFEPLDLLSSYQHSQRPVSVSARRRSDLTCLRACPENGTWFQALR